MFDYLIPLFTNWYIFSFYNTVQPEDEQYEPKHGA